MPQNQIACPWCNQRIEVNPGGWAFERSQVTSHLGGCTKRPHDGGMSEINIAADRILASLGD